MTLNKKVSDADLENRYRPYFRAGVEYAPQKLVKEILSGDLPKAYQNYSEQRTHTLKVQAALSEQGYGHLLQGNNKTKKNFGLDGLFFNNSKEARRAWLFFNPSWKGKSLEAIDQEILRRSQNHLGIRTVRNPDAGVGQDQSFLDNNMKIPSVDIKHEDGRVTTLSFSGVYREAYDAFVVDMKEAKRLYGQGKEDESFELFKKSAKEFLRLAYRMGENFDDEGLKAQWKKRVDQTILTWNESRRIPS